jgi:two-component system cell cycle response regulator DivK
MDIQLPHMDGYEATRRIKADPELKSIPVIAVTSYALSGDNDKAHAAGSVELIVQPDAHDCRLLPRHGMIRDL